MKIRKPLAALLATATMAALAATSGAATALAIENPTVTCISTRPAAPRTPTTPIARLPTVRQASCMA